jgi:predicted XRE-type DNA-binding protein
MASLSAPTFHGVGRNRGDVKDKDDDEQDVGLGGELVALLTSWISAGCPELHQTCESTSVSDVDQPRVQHLNFSISHLKGDQPRHQAHTFELAHPKAPNLRLKS